MIKKYRRPGRLAIPIIALSAFILVSQPAVAREDDRFELFVSQGITSDDNIFRLSDELDPETAIGAPSAADTFYTTSFGANLDLPVSRQRFVADIVIERTQHDRFTMLELDGHQGSLSWQWAVGKRWSGQLGYGESVTLASLANVQSGVQTRSPNFLTIRQTTAGAQYSLTQRWYAALEFENLQNRNSDADFAVSNLDLDRADLSLRYTTPGGSTFGVRSRATDAELPNLQMAATGLIDNSYRQRDETLFVEWPPTEDSELRVQAGRVTRTHADLPGRDYSGGVYTIAWSWRATGKLTLSAIRQRDISPYEQVNVGFVLLDGLTLQAYWRATDKVQLTLRAFDAERRYLGEPGLAFASQPPRTEQFRQTELRIEYRPVAFVRLSLALRRHERTSDAEFGDFDADVLEFTVRGSY